MKSEAQTTAVDTDKLIQLAATTLWVIDKMFEDGYEAYPSTLYGRLRDVIGKENLKRLTEERAQAKLETT